MMASGLNALMIDATYIARLSLASSKSLRNRPCQLLMSMLLEYKARHLSQYQCLGNRIISNGSQARLCCQLRIELLREVLLQ